MTTAEDTRARVVDITDHLDWWIDAIKGRRGLGRSPNRNQIWCILPLKSDRWWQQFQWFSWEPTDQISCNFTRQECPAVADKPARCETMPKIAPIRR